MITLDWQVLTRLKLAFYCLTRKVFSTLPESKRYTLTLPEWFSTAKRWKKLVRSLSMKIACHIKKLDSVEFIGH